MHAFRSNSPASLKTFFLLFAALSPLFAGCSGSTPVEPRFDGWAVARHTRLSYVWAYPAELTWATVDQPDGFRFWHNFEPVEGVVWVDVLPGGLAGASRIDRADLTQQLDKVERQLFTNAALLAVQDRGNMSITRTTVIGARDRMGAPAELREYRLTLNSLDQYLPSFIADFGARQLGGKSVIAERHSAADSFVMVLGMAPLLSPFDEPVVNELGQALGVYTSWAAVPARLSAADTFERLVVDWLERFPVASRFAQIAETSETLSTTQDRATIAVIVVIDPGVFQTEERARLRDDLLDAIDGARTGGNTELRVALVRACDGSVVAPSGSDTFVSSSSTGFLDEVGQRIGSAFDVDPLDCLPNLMQRSALLAARDAGTPWESAEKRWFLWITKRPETATPSLEDINVAAFPDEYRLAFQQEQAELFAVGPSSRTCNEVDRTTVGYEPVLVGGFDDTVATLGGMWFEYCDAWSELLGQEWSVRTAGESGLKLSRPPFPGTLRVFAGSVSLPPDSPFGYLLDTGSLTLIPGESVTINDETVWQATYTTWIEPDVSEL